MRERRDPRVAKMYKELAYKIASLPEDKQKLALQHLWRIQHAWYHSSKDTKYNHVHVAHCYYRVRHYMDQIKPKQLEAK